MIDSFQGANRFLSNFWPATVVFEGATYPSSENAYQAAKTTDLFVREMFQKVITPGQAKRIGREVPLRSDWDKVKRQVMLDIVRDKFTRSLSLKTKLVLTGDHELIEGNHWNDTYWGVCRGNGTNHLGRILMEVRREIRETLS